jgi:hypothetical protein
MTRNMSYEHCGGKEGGGKGTVYEKCCTEYCAMEGIQAVEWRGRGLLVPQSYLCSSTAFYIIYCCKVLSCR